MHTTTRVSFAPLLPQRSQRSVLGEAGTVSSSCDDSVVQPKCARKVWHVYDMLLLSSAKDGTCLLWGVTALGMVRSNPRCRFKLAQKERFTRTTEACFFRTCSQCLLFRGTIVVRVRGALTIQLVWPALPPEQHRQNQK